MTSGMYITVWNEYRHEREEEFKKIYPDGMHAAIAEYLREEGFDVGTAVLDEPEHGLTDEVLAKTDVLFWWGHCAHDEVSDEIVNKVYGRVMQGMGLIVLHSGHASKIFRKLMGTDSYDLKWRESGDMEILWNCNPGHPITKGIGDKLILPHEETYGEHFIIPEPDETVFISWFTGGEVFRSGICYRRGRGKIFYFRPGHEAFPTYYDPNVRKVLKNAVIWAAPEDTEKLTYGWVPATV
ncbi:MAG: ThuA domain-containing protein [Clostridia bacterium]|nr:ThuA domain-containing protein [Clostridia bacterium]